MEVIISYITELISGMLPLSLLIICGMYLTLKGNFFQIRLFPKSVKLMKKAVLSKDKGEGLSSFQAACTSLSAAVGTGNIAGVSAALSVGGAGAVFWMWTSAVFGMAIKAAEITIGIKYRKKSGDTFIGGPMIYIKEGLPKALKPLGYVFAIAGLPTVFCTGNITQTNAAVFSISEDGRIKFICGLVFALLTYFAISGGVKRIGIIAEKTVPLMSVLYLFLCGILIIINIDFLPEAFKMIIVGAFKPRAVTGGAVGSFITSAVIGAQRGVFSNESGLGTAPIAHSLAYDANTEFQGLFGIFEVFVDTILICTLTALTVICSRVNIDYGAVASSELVVKALSTVFGGTSPIIISVMLCVFAFSSIIGWAAYGGIFAEFLLGKNFRNFFMLIYPLGCIVGSVTGVEFAWKMTDFFSGIMLCINLPAIIMLWDNYFKKEDKIYVSKKNRKNKKNTRGKASGSYN